MVNRREGPSTCPFLRSTHVLWLVLETYTGLDARTNHIGPPDHCHVKENHVTGACDLRASVFDSWRAPLRIRSRLRSVDQRYNINLCHVLAHRSTFSECSRRCTSENRPSFSGFPSLLRLFLYFPVPRQPHIPPTFDVRGASRCWAATTNDQVSLCT